MVPRRSCRIWQFPRKGSLATGSRSSASVSIFRRGRYCLGLRRNRWIMESYNLTGRRGREMFTLRHDGQAILLEIKYR